LGIIAIEDSLEEDVKETITSLINSGIKIWMITGDQKLTVESIARSTSLIKEEYYLIDIKDEIVNENENNNEYLNICSMEKLLENLLIKEIENTKLNENFSIIIGSISLDRIFRDNNLLSKVNKLKLIIKIYH
jgi:magnesium-transporting ATPase (P-type)